MKINDFNDVMKKCFGSRLINIPAEKPTKNDNTQDPPEEEIELTCCGDEVTGWVEDYRICPTCKEHI